MCLSDHWWLPTSVRWLLGGYKASQQFVNGSLGFTLLSSRTHQFNTVGDLKRVSVGRYRPTVYSLMRFRINTLWVTILFELSAPSFADPSHLRVEYKVVRNGACASKGGRRALPWLLSWLLHRIVLQALVKDHRRRPGLQSKGSWLTQWEASVNSYRQSLRLAVTTGVGDGADSSEFANWISHLPMTSYHKYIPGWSCQ